MSHVVSSSAPITSAHTVKQYAGFGILGADIPAAGDNGGSPVLNDSPVSTREYHWRVETAPSAGVLTIYPDLAFVWDAAGVSNGSYPWVYRLYEDGVGQGTATVNQTVGTTSAVSADLATGYVVRSAALADSANSYSVRSAISADIGISYAIDNTGAVSTSNSASYMVRGAVQADNVVSYFVRGSLSADLSAVFAVRGVAYASLGASYTIDAALWPVISDLTATYSLNGTSSCPTAAEVAAEVLALLQASTIPVNVKQVNNTPLSGSGVIGDEWGPA